VPEWVVGGRSAGGETSTFGNAFKSRTALKRMLVKSLLLLKPLWRDPEIAHGLYTLTSRPYFLEAS
jgi:hypothetical protein